MSHKKLITIVLVAAVALAGVYGAFAFRSASAQTPTPEAPTTEPQGPDGSIRPGTGRDFGSGANSEGLADALGITVDELTAAYAQAKVAGIQQALEAGLITQAQAEEMRENSAVHPFGGRWGSWLSENGIDYQALLADALGISADELQAAIATAFNSRIDQAVANGNLTQEKADLLKGQYALSNSEDFRSAMQSAFEAAVNQAVESGIITQAQADQILENMSARGWLKGFDGPGSFGRRHGGHGGWDEGAPALPSTPSETSPSDADV